jgi:hypothetical protein
VYDRQPNTAIAEREGMRRDSGEERDNLFTRRARKGVEFRFASPQTFQLMVFCVGWQLVCSAGCLSEGEDARGNANGLRAGRSLTAGDEDEG